MRGKTGLKQLFHYVLIFVLRVERLLRGWKIRVVNKQELERIKEIKGPLIFSPAHCGKFDIQTLAEVIWLFRWSLLSGDYQWLPGTVEGYWLKFHGVIYVNRDDKAWRARSKQEMVKSLRSGQNIMMYPEGTWNLSPELPVLPLFRGIADVAAEANATIIPFGQEIDDDGKTYYVKIGKPISAGRAPLAVLQELREQMAELKWTLIEELPFCKAEYDKEKLYSGWERYIKKRVSECPYYSYELSWKYARKEKWQMEREQIKADLSGIRPTMQNAFLFHKNLK